ncbi:hypothetical protein CF15_05950 [Pyrodictium occultum]|uniref:Uncharacterized protein n=1 Tax=Pyrodictium occultum TaxID=2309 RepID=A0A0V8RW84_PYROC|nr:hypothetical protein [Pyrodictium occultum]KSW12289.1 hypothetical protein CF15_05950 [Pyrodictium occultum]
MYQVLEIAVIHGFGPVSKGVRDNARLAVEALRELGLAVDYVEVPVPVLDSEGLFEPVVLANNVEVYIPSIKADPEKLADYILAVAGAAGVGVAGFPLPPVTLAD